jgi:hypothetical protein
LLLQQFHSPGTPTITTCGAPTAHMQVPGMPVSDAAPGAYKPPSSNGYESRTSCYMHSMLQRTCFASLHRADARPTWPCSVLRHSIDAGHRYSDRGFAARAFACRAQKAVDTPFCLQSALPCIGRFARHGTNRAAGTLPYVSVVAHIHRSHAPHASEFLRVSWYW